MVTNEEILQIAKLAKLNIAPQELDGLRADLGEILDFAHTIASVEDETVQTASLTGLENVLRADAVAPSLRAEEVLANATDSDGSSFVVKNHA